MVEGLIAFVYGAFKKRRATRRTMHCDRPPSLSPPQTPERFAAAAAGAYDDRPHQSQSCRFVVVPRSLLVDELHLLRGGGDDDERWVSRSHQGSMRASSGCVQESRALLY
ncbi:hypothetical protein BS78_02G244200 [Paspalum vaginatum]|nr:hypothetical protein BS78_02G244200 [Paspalum vaginatum]